MARKQPPKPLLTVSHTGRVTLDVARNYEQVATLDDLQEFVDHARSLASFYGGGGIAVYSDSYRGDDVISFSATKKESSK